jgi:hypothetical protein
MSNIFKLLSVCALSMSVLSVAHARAGSLVSCQGTSTMQGFRYVGIYCVDSQCRYTTQAVFSTYCPFTLR